MKKRLREAAVNTKPTPTKTGVTKRAASLILEDLAKEVKNAATDTAHDVEEDEGAKSQDYASMSITLKINEMEESARTNEKESARANANN